MSMPNRIAVPVTLASQQATVAARTATLEQLRERLESGEPPEKKVSRMTEEEQRLVQQALQRNLFSMARQIPMKIKINGKGKLRLEVHEGSLQAAAPSPGCQTPFGHLWALGRGQGHEVPKTEQRNHQAKLEKCFGRVYGCTCYSFLDDA